MLRSMKVFIYVFPMSVASPAVQGQEWQEEQLDEIT